VSASEQHQRARAAFQRGRARLPAGGLREGFRPERRFDPGAHGVQIDPDSGQRVPVQAVEQDRSRSGATGDLLRDVFDRGTAGVQDGARRPRVVPGHYRLPIRLPGFRCTACLVTPSGPAMPCQDRPSFHAFSTWRISSRSVSARRHAALTAAG
jgi:hypothetical protein